jgi:hypothetical protein
MQIFGPDYSKLDAVLDPAVTRAALEQKTRFFKPAQRQSTRDEREPTGPQSGSG